jgi:mono/diheme cytochrome c family protein
MRKVLKWIGIVLGGLVGLVVLAILFLFIRSSMILNKSYEAPADSITIPTDEASVERGRHLVTTLADCQGCHGENLGGNVVFEDPAIGRAVAPNLTTGENGLGDDLSNADFVNAIRYGVMPDGKSVRIMPSYDFYYMSDEDLGAVIAYIRSVPPVDSDLPSTEFGPLGRILIALGQLPVTSAERVDQDAQRLAVEPGPTAEYGHYIARLSCMGCHGEGLSGGQIIGAPPGFPQAANLTPGGEVGNWSEEDFVQTIRTGVNPTGHELDPEMPWMVFRNLSEEELHAIWLYLQSVPAKEFGNH